MRLASEIVHQLLLASLLRNEMRFTLMLQGEVASNSILASEA
jgi:hypothetical protein